MRYQEETINEYRKISEGTIAQREMELGLHGYEPLIICMDAMLRYAKAYKKHYESKLIEDYVLGPEYAKVISGIRGLLNGQGAFAMEKGLATDSKDNGAVESLYWQCCEVAGFNGNLL